MLCRRIGDVPAPVQVEAAHYAYSVMGSRSVQVAKRCGPAAPIKRLKDGGWRIGGVLVPSIPEAALHHNKGVWGNG